MPLYRNPTLTVAYQEFTSTVTVSGTSGAQTTVVTAPTFTADGVTSYWVEFFCTEGIPGTSDALIVELWEGASDLGHIAALEAGTSPTSSPCVGKRKVTPATGSRQYIIKAYRVTTNASLIAGAGGVVTYLPGYISVTKAI